MTDNQDLKDPHAELKAQYDIQVLRPSRIKQLLRSHLQLTDFKVHRAQHLALIGESGVGKTAMVTQIHKELGRFLLPLRVSNMDEGQSNGYPVPSQTRGEIELSMVSQYRKPLEEAVKVGKKITIFFDELNRAKLSLIKTIFNIVDEKMWAGFQLPKDTAFVVAMNPPSEIHNVMDIFGEESALNSRFKLVGVKANLVDFLMYADSVPEFHPIMKDWVKDNPGKLEDFDNMYAGKKYMCPAVIENVGRFLTSVEKSGIPLVALNNLDHMDIRDNICSMGGTTTGLDIIKYITDVNRNLNPEAVVNTYCQALKPHIYKEGALTIEHSELVPLATNLAKFIAGMHLDFDAEQDKGKNLATFLDDLPDPPLAAFLETLRNALGSEADNCLETLHTQLSRHEEFISALERMLQLQRKLHMVDF